MPKSRYLVITPYIYIKMLDGETKEQCENRLVKRIYPDAIIGWEESKVEIDDDVSADGSDDLISRSAAIAEIEDYIEEYSDVDPETGLHNPKWCAMEEAKDVLIKAPAAPSITVTHVNHGDGSLIDSIDDTITAFMCCVQTPPDCAKCPCQGPGFGFVCRQNVKDGVAFWLNRAKESMRK